MLRVQYKFMVGLASLPASSKFSTDGEYFQYWSNSSSTAVVLLTKTSFIDEETTTVIRLLFDFNLTVNDRDNQRANNDTDQAYHSR